MKLPAGERAIVDIAKLATTASIRLTHADGIKLASSRPLSD